MQQLHSSLDTKNVCWVLKLFIIRLKWVTDREVTEGNILNAYSYFDEAKTVTQYQQLLEFIY